ncbi:MAG: hypothetical protein ACKVIH_12900, partial [Burkholderiales bacterium]
VLHFRFETALGKSCFLCLKIAVFIEFSSAKRPPTAWCRPETAVFAVYRAFLRYQKWVLANTNVRVVLLKNTIN